MEFLTVYLDEEFKPTPVAVRYGKKRLSIFIVKVKN